MTDPLLIIRDADPAAGVTPDRAALDRMDAAIERRLAVDRAGDAGAPHARTRRTRRAQGSRWTRTLAGAAATIAVVAALAALPSGGGDSPVAPAPASAAEALRRLGATAAEASTPNSRYVYVHSRSFATHMRPRRGGRGIFATVVPIDVRVWVARDGSERIERYRQLWDQATYPTAQDRIDAQAAGPLPRLPDEGPAVRYTDTKVAGFTVAELRALPTDPAELRTRLERAELGFKSPSPLVTATGFVLSSPLTPPRVRAAAFAVLRALPGARLLAGATDPTGRGGSAVEFDGDAWRTLYIFDPKTSDLIATRSIGKKEMPGRNISDWTLQLDSAAAARAPVARDAADEPQPPPRVRERSKTKRP